MVRVLLPLLLTTMMVLSGLLISGGSEGEADQKLTLVMMGDIVFNGNLGRLTETQGADYPFEEIHPYIEGADITLANLETPLSERGSPEEGKYCTFRMEPKTVESLKYAGIDAVSFSNNHCLDYGPDALNDTLDLLDEEGIGHAGIYFGDNIENAKIPRPLLITAGDLRIGLLAYTEDVSTHWRATDHYPGPMPLDRSLMESDIKASRDLVDLLIVSIHWRKWPQYTEEPEDKDIDLCHDVVDWGADIIMGHGPHTVHRVEGYKDSLILYSLGNVAMDNGNDTSDNSYITKVSIVDGKLDGLELIPIHKKSYRYIPMGTPIDRSYFDGYNISREEVLGMYDQDIYDLVDDEWGKNDIRMLYAISPWYLKGLLGLLLLEIILLFILIADHMVKGRPSKK